MARGIVDITITESLKENTILLVTDCGNGFPHDLHFIQDGVTATLTNGSLEREVRIERAMGFECSFHYIEISPGTAKAFDLVDKGRYLMEYDEAKNTIKLNPITISRSMAVIKPVHAGSGPKRMTIGYALLSMLGMAERRPDWVTLKKGAVSLKLRLQVPRNELDEGFRLHPSIVKKLGLKNGQHCLLEYNQSTNILQFTKKEESAASSSRHIRKNKKNVEAGSFQQPFRQDVVSKNWLKLKLSRLLKQSLNKSHQKRKMLKRKGPMIQIGFKDLGKRYSK